MELITRLSRCRVKINRVKTNKAVVSLHEYSISGTQLANTRRQEIQYAIKVYVFVSEKLVICNQKNKISRIKDERLWIIAYHYESCSNVVNQLLSLESRINEEYEC